VTDIVSPAVRSRMMAGIKGKNTKPELIVRSYLHRAGFRFSLHRKDLPGRPDIVLPKYRTVVFVHGCFWHRHEGCRFATTPGTRRAFWLNKLRTNQLRDQRAIAALNEAGWRTYVLWDCELTTGRLDELIHRLARIRDGSS
jgi:DNA mismatch endonuclease (patch repair protein)